MSPQIEEILKYVAVYGLAIGFTATTISAGLGGRAWVGIFNSPIAVLFVSMAIHITLKDAGWVK